MSDLNAAKKNVISFDESPTYIKGGKLRDYQVTFTGTDPWYDLT